MAELLRIYLMPQSRFEMDTLQYIPEIIIIKKGTCVKFWVLISHIVVNEVSSLLVLE